MPQTFKVQPIGVVCKQDRKIWIDIDPRFQAGLLGLDSFSHIIVFYWFHCNDTPEARSTLQVHPRKDPANPLTGVFATHSPKRPNLIAMTICTVLSVEESRIRIDDIDAFDQSPVIDIKCHIPRGGDDQKVKVPDWAK
jgi:tRNA-Thr(GGU) m(6)t(6)A37 methyltransferase TsaA